VVVLSRDCRVFKWLTLVLLAYVATAFVAGVRLAARAARTLAPRVGMVTRLLLCSGRDPRTTISPYLFFWQAAQDSRRGALQGRNLAHRRGATGKELNACRTDVITGMFASNAIMYFIIMTTAATLTRTARRTSRRAGSGRGAADRWPRGCVLLFTLGLIARGCSPCPCWRDPARTAIAEAAAWRGSLNRTPSHAKKFYIVLASPWRLGYRVENYGRPRRVKLLFTTAVINGVLALH